MSSDELEQLALHEKLDTIIARLDAIERQLTYLRQDQGAAVRAKVRTEMG